MLLNSINVGVQIYKNGVGFLVKLLPDLILKSWCTLQCRGYVTQLLEGRHVSNELQQ